MAYPTNEYLATLAATCAGIAGGVLALWRRQSKTKLDVKTDTIQGSALEDVFKNMRTQHEEIRAERDAWKAEAHQTRNEHMIAIAKVAMLTQENETLKAQVLQLNLRVGLLEKRLGVQIVDTQPGDL